MTPLRAAGRDLQLANLDLSPPNRVLLALAAHGPQTAAELAARVGLTVAEAAATCRRLAEAGRVAGSNDRPMKWRAT